MTISSIAFADKGEEQKHSQKISENQNAARVIWDKFIELLSQSLRKSEVETWFSVITPKDFSDNILTVVVPSKDYYGMIERRFNKQIVSVLESGLLGENGKLTYEVVQDDLFSSQNENPEPKISPKEKISNVVDFNYKFGNSIKTDGDFSSNLFSRYTFENLVKGDGNDYAVSNAYAITNNLGKLYNPFFVFGGVGLGKTHLIQAIGHEVIKKYPDKRVFYTTTPDFTTLFTTSIQKGDTKTLDAFYKSLDVLILDDIQNLEGKPSTQDFVYQIFNTLYNNKKHLIFSSDKPINQVKNIEERLISRFQWGITADIQPPSWEMRVAIINKKLETDGVEFSEEIIHYVATNVKDSIRTIEGCIAGMISESNISNDGEINFEIAERVIQRVVGTVKRAKNVSVESIIYTVADYFKVSENMILSRKRTKEIAFARQVAMYLAKELTAFTLESIGLNFGGKDHATVLYSHNCIKNLMKKDSNTRLMIGDIKEQIKNM